MNPGNAEGLTHLSVAGHLDLAGCAVGWDSLRLSLCLFALLSSSLCDRSCSLSGKDIDGDVPLETVVV